MRASGLQLIVLVVCFCGMRGHAATLSTSASTSTSASAGTNVANQFNNDLETANDNIYRGVTALSDPILRFAVDTAPHLVHLYALANGVNVPPAMAALAKDILGKAAVAGGSLVGNAAVLGSSIAKDAAKVGGTVLDSKYRLMEAAAEAGIKVAGAAADQLIEAGALKADLISRGLSTLGDGMQVASVTANVVSLEVARLLQALGTRLASSLESAEKALATLAASGSSSLTAGAQQLTNGARQQLYTALNNYLTFLASAQALLDIIPAVIAGSSTASATITATTA